MFTEPASGEVNQPIMTQQDCQAKRARGRKARRLHNNASGDVGLGHKKGEADDPPHAGPKEMSADLGMQTTTTYWHDRPLRNPIRANGRRDTNAPWGKLRNRKQIDRARAARPKLACTPALPRKTVNDEGPSERQPGRAWRCGNQSKLAGRGQVWRWCRREAMRQ